MPKIDTSELKEFLDGIADSIKEIMESKPVIIREPIEVEVAIAKVKTGKGDISLKIVEAGGKYQAHETSRIKIKIEPNFDVIKPMEGRDKSPRIIPHEQSSI